MTGVRGTSTKRKKRQVCVSARRSGLVLTSERFPRQRRRLSNLHDPFLLAIICSQRVYPSSVVRLYLHHVGASRPEGTATGCYRGAWKGAPRPSPARRGSRPIRVTPPGARTAIAPCRGELIRPRIYDNDERPLASDTGLGRSLKFTKGMAIPGRSSPT